MSKEKAAVGAAIGKRRVRKRSISASFTYSDRKSVV